MSQTTKISLAGTTSKHAGSTVLTYETCFSADRIDWHTQGHLQGHAGGGIAEVRNE